MRIAPNAKCQRVLVGYSPYGWLVMSLNMPEFVLFSTLLSLSCTLQVHSKINRDVKVSKPSWPRGQNFGFDLCLTTANAKILASQHWPRPPHSWPTFRPRPSGQKFGLGLSFGLEGLFSFNITDCLYIIIVTIILISRIVIFINFSVYCVEQLSPFIVNVVVTFYFLCDRPCSFQSWFTAK